MERGEISREEIHEKAEAVRRAKIERDNAEVEAKRQAAQKKFEELEEIKAEIKWAVLYQYPNSEYNNDFLNRSIERNIERYNNGELTRERLQQVANEAREVKRKECEAAQAQIKKYNALAAKGQFEFDGLLIQRKEKSTSFLLPNEGNKEVTPYEIIKRLSGNAFKSYKVQIKFKNDKIQILPYAERIRLVFYFRLQDKKPQPIENADTIAAFINTAIKYTGDWKLKQNWYACLSATQTQEEAASLFVYYGWAATYDKEFPRIENAFYKVEADNGIRHYEIVQGDIISRFEAIESKAQEVESLAILTNKTLDREGKYNQLQALLKPLLWWNNNIRLGLTTEARELCEARISEYIENLWDCSIFDGIEHISRVQIDKSATDIVFAEPRKFIISMDDLESVDYQYNIGAEYNKQNAAKLGAARSKKAAERNFEHVTGDKWTTQELYAQGIDKDKIPRLIDSGLIKRIRQGHYIRIIR